MRTLLFVGHRPDGPARTTPRFPRALEDAARTAIREVVRRLAGDGPARGIAGGASGGDILFHEVCLDLGIPSELYLALPPDAFVAASVAPAGDEWVQRFRTLLRQLPSPRQLSDTPASPHDARLWERNNSWLLDDGLRGGAENLTLIALWDGEPGDGPGGTDALVAMARARGVAVEIIDPRRLASGTTAADSPSGRSEP